MLYAQSQTQPGQYASLGTSKAKNNVLFNVDNHVSQVLTQESTKEDFYLFGDVFTGLQKWNIQTKQVMTQKTVPVNEFVSQGSDRQKLHLLQEKSLQKICQMAHKMESVNKLSKGSSL